MINGSDRYENMVIYNTASPETIRACHYVVVNQTKMVLRRTDESEGRGRVTLVGNIARVLLSHRLMYKLFLFCVFLDRFFFNWWRNLKLYILVLLEKCIFIYIHISISYNCPLVWCTTTKNCGRKVVYCAPIKINRFDRFRN